MTLRVCLASICSGSVAQIKAMIESAAPYVDEAVVVIAPGNLLALEVSSLAVPTTRIDHPWEGYAKTRSFALREAEKRAEWVLTLDDDDRYEAGGSLPPLDDPNVDAYTLPISLGGVTFYRPHLTRRGRNWRFEGCGSSGLHEALYGDGRAEMRKWNRLAYLSGPPSVPTAERYTEHARLLQIAITEEPSSTRTAFYLAQSLRDAANLSGGEDRGALAAALAAYVHRANMIGGFSEETFWSWMNAGRIAWRLGMPWEAVASFFAYAQTWGPDRAEPRADLARLYDAWGKADRAREMRAEAASLPYPSHALLFVEPIYSTLIKATA